MFDIKDGIRKEMVPPLTNILICSVILIAFTGCSTLGDAESDVQEWKYGELRVIDPVDAAIPNLDIVAVFVSDDSTKLSIRVDLLDIELSDSQHFFIMIDYKPGGSQELPFDSDIETRTYNPWDLAIEFTIDGQIRGYDSRDEKIHGLQASIYKDIFLDTITVNISKSNLIPERSPFTLDIFMLEPSNGILADSVMAIHSSGLPPPPSHVLIGFSNTFTAYTPAQVLRKWDGAHTGPMSSRHGLRYLVEGSESYNLPIALFDVGIGPARVALEFLGVLDGVDLLGVESVLDCVGGIDYTQNEAGVNEYRLSIDTRVKIAQAALTGERLCIGGDFSKSLWGIPATVRQVFHYLKGHPWIVPVATTDLQTTIADNNDWNYCNGFSKPILEIDLIDPTLSDYFLQQYKSTPDNILKELAWKTYQTLLCPVNKINVVILESYFRQLGHILSAAKWMENPISISKCDVDLDWDGDSECVLASGSIFLTAELQGGYFVFAFYKDGETVHQILGPMYEVVVGLGDPITYITEDGVFADARLNPGSLAISEHQKEKFKYKLDRDHIELYSETLRLRKTIRINEKQIQFEWISDNQIDSQISLILDPWLRFTPDWSSQYVKLARNGDWVWEIDNQFEIAIKANSNYKFYTFLDSRSFLNQPEDPNFEYPKGHYLPFPIAILDISPTKTATIELIFYQQR